NNDQELFMSDIYFMQNATGETNSPSQEFDPIGWALLNPWLSEGQADDRTPMNGAVKDSGGTPSVQRSLARRSHQAMFKKWSQARRDYRTPGGLSPNSFGVTHNLGVTCYFAGRLFGRGFLLIFFLLV